MTYISEEYSAEFSAHVEFAENWLAEKEGPLNETDKKSGLGRGLGFAAFKWRGQEISTVVMLYRFYLAQRLWEHYCLLYTSPSPRDATLSRMPSSA